MLLLLVVLALLFIVWRISREAARWDDRLLQVLAPRFTTMPALWRYVLAVGIIIMATVARDGINALDWHNRSL